MFREGAPELDIVRTGIIRAVFCSGISPVGEDQ